MSYSPQDVKLYGYNVFNGNQGSAGSVPLTWHVNPSGSLTNFQSHRISELTKKPFATDKTWIEQQMQDRAYSAIKSQITTWYNHLINTYSPGSEYHTTGEDAKSYFENGTGWADLRQSSDTWVSTLWGWFSSGYQAANTTVLDITDLGGPARGVAPSELGTQPSTFDISPVFRPYIDADLNDLLKHPSDLMNNVNFGIKELGIEAVYQNSYAKLSLETLLDNPLQFSERQWEFDTSQIKLGVGFSTKNIPVFPGDPKFNFKVESTFNSDENRFNNPALNAEVRYVF